MSEGRGSELWLELHYDRYVEQIIIQTCVDANPPLAFRCVVNHFITDKPSAKALLWEYTNKAYDVISMSIGFDCLWGGDQWCEWDVVVWALCQCFIPSTKIEKKPWKVLESITELNLGQTRLTLPLASNTLLDNISTYIYKAHFGH